MVHNLQIEGANELFNATSFPSKVLSYMANGLCVVSADIEVLRQSKINELICYYNGSTGEKIAEAIRKVDLSQNDMARKKLVNLYEDFANSLKGMLEEV